MSDLGTDNPAFSNADECIDTSTNGNLENSHTESVKQEHKDKSSLISNGHSFVSQHYVEPTQNTPDVQYKTETRIELPNNGEEKTSNTVKANGVNGNSNNNDVSFLNTSVTSAQINDGKKEQIEAVNLELVSMRPYTGNNLQTKGQEACELPSDPYEEYFVPVNEHRKYISSSPRAEIETTVAGVRFDLGPGVGREGLSLRDPTAGLVDYSHWLNALRGEKLYVTKDKRTKSSYWRRIACWTFGLTVLALALVIAILAGTGVILTQEATQPLDNDHQRSLDDVNTAGSKEFIKNPPASPPPETSTFPPWQTTDESMLKTVPEAVEGSIWLDNLIWNDDLMDAKSRVYRSTAMEIENSLRDMILPVGSITIVKVYNITSNGQVMFRIGYPPTPTPEMLQESIEKKLRENNNMIGKYHLTRMNVKRLVDECQYGYLNCSGICKFDYIHAVFSCEEDYLSDISFDAEDPNLTSLEDMVQGRGRIPEHSFESEDHDHWMHHHYHEHVGSVTEININNTVNRPQFESTLQTSTEPKLKSEPAAEPTPEPSAEPKPEPESNTTFETIFELNAEPKAEPEPIAEATAEPKVEPEPAAEPKVEPEPTAEPKVEPEPTAEPKVEPEPTTELKTMPESFAEPTVEPKVEPESTAEPKAEPEPISEPTAEPNVKPEPTAESQAEPEPTAEPIVESEPVVEPTAEPKAEPEPIAEPTAEPEPIAEPTAEPDSLPEPIAKSTEEPKAKPEPIAEPEPSAEPQAEPEPITEPEPSAEPQAEPESITEPEPTMEQKAELEPIAESIATFEPVPEPKSESEFKAASDILNEPTEESKLESKPENPLETTAAPEPITKLPLDNNAFSEPTSELKTESNLRPETQFEEGLKPDTEAPREPKLELEVKTEPTINPTLKPDFPKVTDRLNPNLKSFESSTTQLPIDSRFNVDSNPEPLPVIPLSTSINDNSLMDVSKEIPEMLPTAIPKISDIQSDDPYHRHQIDDKTFESTTLIEVENEDSTMNPTMKSSEFEGVESSTIMEQNSTTIPNISETHFTDLTTIMPETKIQYSNNSNAVDQVFNSGFPKVPQEIIENIEPLNDSVNNSTPPYRKENNQTIISQLTPERIDPYMLIKNSLEANKLNEKFDSTTISSNSQPLAMSNGTTENRIGEVTITYEKDKNHEVMSPFLPEIIIEKDSSKKAPRLDKDEQHYPNPFEPNVEDVIVHNLDSKTDTLITLNYDVNGTEFTDLVNKFNVSHGAQQTETSHKEDASIVDMMTTMTTTLLNTQINLAMTKKPVVDAEDLEIRHMDGMITSKVMNDMHIEQSNNSNANDDKSQENYDKVMNDPVSVTVIPRENEKLYGGIINSQSTDFDESKSITAIDKNQDSSDSHNKFDENAVEDQYNDIIEERISKKIESNGSKLSNKNLLTEEPDVKSTTVKNEKTTLTIDDNTTSDFISDLNNVKTTLKVTSEKPVKDKTDDNNKFTTEIPIMPVEIQQDISTTEITEKIESTMISNLDNIVTNVAEITTPMSFVESKMTTIQTPIMPKEFMTTEIIMPEKIPLTSFPSESIGSTTENLISRQDSEPTTESPKVSTTGFEDIKPVSELIFDDPEPDIFDHTKFFTTTESALVGQTLMDQSVSDDLSEELLKIIPLDIDDVKEKTSMETTEIPAIVNIINTTDISMSTVEQNMSSVPRLKIVEITSASQQPQNWNHSLIIHNTTSVPQTHQTEQMNSRINNIASVHPTPDAIPVYEAVEEDEENPMIIPFNRMKNIIPLPNTTIRSKEEEEEEQQQQQQSENVNKDITTTGIMSTTVATIKTMSPDEKSTIAFKFSKCNIGQFQCVNGTSRDGAYCVNLSSKCDSENDCSDGSDELNCEDEGCPGNFQCKSGQCLGRHLVCNGIVDCDDGSDEVNCKDWVCHFDEFKCPNGRCIPDLWRCNGRPDCEDHRDEYSCSKSCGNDEYLCPSENWCIPQTWRCNGVPECANGEDEKLCDCSLDQFKCQTGGCVALEQVCDGIEHCPDRSDEWDCLLTNTTNLNQSNSDDSGRQVPIGQPMLLKIKKFDNKYYSICGDNWTKNHSDLYCKLLGYFGSETTETIEINDYGKILRLKELKENHYQDTMNLIADLELSDHCASKQFVKVSCQEFSCGSLDNEGPTARLVGGTTAGEGQWSSVALLKETKSGTACTASVLGPMHALVSYSCIHKYRQSNNWEIFTGRDLQKSTQVKNIIPYPQVKYNQFLYNDDIALIQLEEPLVFSRNVSAVCVPNQQFQPRALCVTAGWGFPLNGEINLKLKFLPIPIYNTEECNATSHYAGFITKSNICAGFTGADKGTCYNDEGAPLMCASETGRWELQGLLSHHSRCSRDHPAIYSSLSPTISWLHHSIPALQNRIL